MIHYKIRQCITPRDTDSIKLYLKEIAKYKVLTPEEEIELATKVQQGDETAKTKLIESNLKFVVSIAKQYLGKGLDLEDLIAVGNCGLIKAAEKFNPDLGFRFLSYAGWWIRDFIINEIITNGKLIRIPFNKTITLNKINHAISTFENEYGHIPSEEELAEVLQIDIDEIETLVKASESSISYDLTEVNVGYSEEHNCGLSAVLPFLKKALTKMEYIVLTKTLGLEGEELEMHEIAKQYNLTRERVRQIKNKAIIKLRKHPDINKIIELI